jgi:hypothetical protein
MDCKKSWKEVVERVRLAPAQKGGVNERKKRKLDNDKNKILT